MAQEFEQLKIKIEKRPCHICGNRDFEWGYIDSAYQPGLFTTKYDTRRHLLASRKCLHCNNVQMFADAQSTQKAWRSGCAIVFAVFLLMLLPLVIQALPYLQVLWLKVTS